MTEKEYYDKVDAEYSYVNELLNQLDSAYGDGYADGYKQAVDEFVEKMETWNENIKSIRKEDAFFTIENIREIAEELKTTRGSE